jgi:hypothetical protein
MPRLPLRALFVGVSASIAFLAPHQLLGEVQNQPTISDGQVFVRAADGRWEPQARRLTASDVPLKSPLHGVEVIDSPGGRSATVVRVGSASHTDLRPGDLVDEIQLAGLTDRERQANPGYWPYQVWAASDFYRLAVQCTPGCLVRLRGVESTTFGISQTLSGPRVFGYRRLGAGSGFAETLDDSATKVAGYVDARTGDRFAPAASTAFAPEVSTGQQ